MKEASKTTKSIKKIVIAIVVVLIVFLGLWYIIGRSSLFDYNAYMKTAKQDEVGKVFLETYPGALNIEKTREDKSNIYLSTIYGDRGLELRIPNSSNDEQSLRCYNAAQNIPVFEVTDKKEMIEKISSYECHEVLLEQAAEEGIYPYPSYKATSSTDEDAETNGIQTYSSEYNYRVTYLTEYENSDEYSVWTAQNEDLGIINSWGVNKGQESIFVIEVYSLEKKDELIDAYKHEVLEDTTTVGNKTAHKTMVQGVYDGLSIETDNYFYIISSSIASLTDTPEYEMYLDILNGLEFTD